MTCKLTTALVASLLAAGLGSAAAAQEATFLPSTPTTMSRGVIDPARAPVLTIKSGTTVKIDTVSHGGLGDDPVAFFAKAGIPKSGILTDALDAAKLPRTEGFGGHVLTGPIFIESAEPGDLLEVRIHKVTPRVPYGVNNPGTGGAAPGLLTERHDKIIKFDMEKNVAVFSDEIEIPLRPFMGIMAVAPAPAVGKVSTRAPGPFGGNMDFKDLKDGATLYMPVFNTGALFSVGDSHATQGDGEVSGNAIEASMTATLEFIVHKGKGVGQTYPYAEDAENFYIMGMNEDLDKALTSSIVETVKFLQKEKGLSAADAYSLCSIAVDFAIAEAVDGVLVIYGKVPKSLFKTTTAYWTQ